MGSRRRSQRAGRSHRRSLYRLAYQVGSGASSISLLPVRMMSYERSRFLPGRLPAGRVRSFCEVLWASDALGLIPFCLSCAMCLRRVSASGSGSGAFRISLGRCELGERNLVHGKRFRAVAQLLFN